MTGHVRRIALSVRQRLTVSSPLPVVRRKKSLFLVTSVLSILLLVDCVFLIPLVREINELGDSITAQADLADRYADKIQEMEKKMRGLQNMDEPLARLTAFAGLDMSVEALASELDASLSRLAPGKLRKVRYRPGRDERAGDVTLAVFEYEMIGDIHGLAALLNGLHDFDAPLLTRELCVKASPRREPPLDIRLQLGVISNVHENLKP